MVLVAPMGVELFIHDTQKDAGYAQWSGGVTFQVRDAMAISDRVIVELQRKDGPLLRRFDVGVTQQFGAFSGDTISLEGAGPAIAANIYETIEEGAFLNEPS